MEFLHELQTSLLSYLALADIPTISRVCRVWAIVEADIFSHWLRWRGDLAVAEVSVTSLAGTDTVFRPRVHRSGGYIEFKDGMLWVQRVVLSQQAVLTESFSCSPTGVANRVSSLLRSWPHHGVIGGLPGGFVAHGLGSMAFFPVDVPRVVEVGLDYQNVLRAGEQVFMLRADGDADILHMETERVVRCDVSSFAKELKGHALVVVAVSATQHHFITHGTSKNGGKVVAWVRLPDAAHADTQSTVVLRPSLLQWPATHPMAVERAPMECPVGDTLALNGSSWSSPVCLFHAPTGEVDVIHLHPVPGVHAEAVIVQTTLNAEHTLFFATLEEKHPGATPSCHLAIWCASGHLLRHLDLSRTEALQGLRNLQLAVHPCQSLVTLDFCRGAGQENLARVETYSLVFH